MKLQSAQLLQSHIRSYLIRKHVKDQQRNEYTQQYGTLSIYDKLKKLLFFYNPKIDIEKLVSGILYVVFLNMLNAISFFIFSMAWLEIF